MSGLDRRVQQLEEARRATHADSATIAERRAHLAPYLADDSIFSSQREAILTALCETTAMSEDDLHCEVRQRHGPGELTAYAAISLAVVDWRMRDAGGEPTLTLFVLPEPELKPEPSPDDPIADTE